MKKKLLFKDDFKHLIPEKIKIEKPSKERIAIVKQFASVYTAQVSNDGLRMDLILN